MFSQLIFKPVTILFSKYPVAGAPAPSNIRNAPYPQGNNRQRVIFNVKALMLKPYKLTWEKNMNL